jgi:hypothetical protein
MSLDDTLERAGAVTSADPGAWTTIGSCADLASQTVYPVAAQVGSSLFVYGGDGANTVLSSPDGVTWTRRRGDWPARSTVSGAALDGKLYIVGGFTSATPTSPARGWADTWCSADGASWTRIGGDAPFGPGWAFTVLAYRSHLYLIGGVNNGGAYTSEVWALEPEGVWRRITTGQFKPRAWAAGAVLGDTLMVIGGHNEPDGTFAEILLSRDAGATWTTYPAPFRARHSATAITIGDTVYLVGGVAGRDPVTAAFHEIWATKDGISWCQVDWGTPSGVAASLSGRLAVLGGSAEVKGTAPPAPGWRIVNQSRTISDLMYAPVLDFVGRLYALCGYGYQPVVVSDDGVNWSNLPSNLPNRQGCAAAVHAGAMWVTGGGRTNDVWTSTDGTHWTQTPPPPWSPREHHGLVSFGGKLWLLGGSPYVGSEVWSSPDGLNWTQVTPNPPFRRRSSFAAVAFGGRIWLLGGDDNQILQDVWCSVDGVAWQQRTPPWGARYHPVAAVVGDTLFVAAGQGGRGDSARKDLWATRDGINWAPYDTRGPWSDAQFGPSLAVKTGSLYLFGGGDGLNIYGIRVA